MIEPCRQAVAVISSQSGMDTWTAAMGATPSRRFREAGLYHFVAGRVPHHERDCGGDCPIGGEPVAVRRRSTR